MKFLTGVLTAVFVFAAMVFAGDEGLSGRVIGKVADQNGAAVAGARVTAQRLGTGVMVNAVTDSEGSFSIELLRGEYSLSITADGFSTETIKVDLRTEEQKLETLFLNVKASEVNVTVSDDSAYAIAGTRSATKTYTPLRDIPQSISVVKAEQIADQSLTSISEVVRYVPGVTSHQGENNRDDVIIRGNRSSADFYRNGVRDDVQYYRDLYNVESMEAIKGSNAMTFGRGGGGGVINRTMKEAGSHSREFTATGGSFNHKRLTGDIGERLNDKFAFRLNGVYENSKSFRRFVGLERGGFNPTFSYSPDSKTSIRVGYEFFRDRRVADRGMTSFQGKPVELPISTYYGDRKNAKVRADVNMLSGTVERLFGNLIFRNHTNYAVYDRFYQNYVPGAVNTAGTLVSLSAYNNATKRKNLFNQTDLTYELYTGKIKHTLLGGTEFGRQLTDNFRQTGYFNNSATSIQVPFADPVTNSPITFRQSATDANNHLSLNLGAAFVQDQITFSKMFQAIIGVRYDQFGLTYHNNRNGETLTRVDRIFSPRVGFVFKPFQPLSLYTSYSVSSLPSSGDQFSSLTTITQQVKPEKFENYEAGVKWDIRRGLSLSSAVYVLDRSNTRSTDPNDPTRIVQTGSQRTTGFELGLTGTILPRWTISGGYAWQNARITSATTAAPVGRQVGQVPHNTFSLWNKYQFTNRLSAGLGLVARTKMFAAIDNTVVLPGYLKADAAVYYTLGEHWKLQANLENITNKRYFVNADSNTNISPGSPRGVKVGLVAKF